MNPVKHCLNSESVIVCEMASVKRYANTDRFSNHVLDDSPAGSHL